MAAETALLEVGVMFAAIALMGAIALRVEQSVIPFYIVGGMLLSAHVVGLLELPMVGSVYVSETDFITIGAELGIVFLLFFLGLEFNLDRLLESRARIAKAGTIDLAINFGIGLLLGLVLFASPLTALLFAGIVYISSSAIITKGLIDLGWIANEEANPILGILVYEDLFIALYLAVVSALVLGGGDLVGAAPEIGIAIGFILGLLILVYVGTATFETLLDIDSNEAMILRTIGVTVLIAGAALALGVSEAVAAFFVGMTFSSTGWVDELEQLLEPLRDVFAAIFFFWIGLVTDPRLFAGVLGILLVGIIFTAPSKLVAGYVGGRVYGLDTRRSTRVGLGMVTRGEFSLIIAAIALAGAGGALTTGDAQTLYAFSVGYVLVMSILGSILMQYSTPIERAITQRLGT